MFPRLTRSFFVVCLLSICAGVAVGMFALPTAGRAQEDVLYFAATGHRLSNANGFLNHWRSSNGSQTLGAPLTEPFEQHGLMVQYFEYGRLEYHPAYDGAILRGRLGAEYAEALWKEFAPPDPVVLGQPEARLFPATGYAVGEPFLSFWETMGGLDVFGLPISNPAWEYIGTQMALVQYFERARLEAYPGASEAGTLVQIGSLGRDLALLRGLPTAAVDPAGASVVDHYGQPLPIPTPLPPTAVPPTAIPPTAVPAAPAPASAPAPTAVPAPASPAPSPRGGKGIIVDLSDQWLYAYEGDRMVFDAPVSTGRDGFNTPVGRYAIYAKVRSQTMSGCIGGECWNVPNVPHAMYIVGDVALHGTYWHNQFGTGVRRSHGCINLPLNAAAWVYEWAPTGTPVTVRW
ncbi:L,D-transpeptidase [Candidatus Chloroploca mongolica]|nr:L,D-transpeptidase [Candidatus Chloroploca mongolica]